MNKSNTEYDMIIADSRNFRRRCSLCGGNGVSREDPEMSNTIVFLAAHGCGWPECPPECDSKDTLDCVLSKLPKLKDPDDGETCRSLIYGGIYKAAYASFSGTWPAAVEIALHKLCLAVDSAIDADPLLKEIFAEPKPKYRHPTPAEEELRNILVNVINIVSKDGSTLKDVRGFLHDQAPYSFELGKLMGIPFFLGDIDMKPAH